MIMRMMGWGTKRIVRRGSRSLGWMLLLFVLHLRLRCHPHHLLPR